ncbi:MAG: hypothetical protein Tsb006_4100 [Rickettsiaceae bacterium]
MIASYFVAEKMAHEFWSLRETKNYLRVSHDYDDELIKQLVYSAIESAENFMGISLHTKRVVVNIKNAATSFKSKYPNVIFINSVTLISGQLRNDITNTYGSFQKERNQICLHNQYKDKNIEIEYLSGFEGGNIPNPIKQGLMMHVALMYERTDKGIALNPQIRDLYLSYRVIKV